MLDSLYRGDEEGDDPEACGGEHEGSGAVRSGNRWGQRGAWRGLREGHEAGLLGLEGDQLPAPRRYLWTAVVWWGRASTPPLHAEALFACSLSCRTLSSSYFPLAGSGSSQELWASFHQESLP